MSAEKPLDPEELAEEEGEFLVNLARESVEKSFVGEKPDFSRVPQKLKRKGAAFVTIEKLEGGRKNLRGCIGFVEPVKPLYLTVHEAALAAAFEDPRFPPLRVSETPLVTYEVSVLSPIRRLEGRPEDRPKLVVVGKMGLIAKKGFFSGLLLPQVPVEEGWGETEFLSYTCLKAGLHPECWREDDVEFYFFTARIFAEEFPGGPVRERKLSG